MLSGSESSASSGGGGVSAAGAALTRQLSMRLQGMQQDEASRLKAEKIRMAMEKIKEANIQKLFLKVFTTDGSAKSLLVDEKMLCSYVTRLLADKNHVQMDPKWGIVEHLPDLYMERFYEDHENLVDNLLLWTRDSKNKIYFVEREDKIRLFLQPEKFLLASTDKKDNSDFDEHSRNMLLEEFFSSTSLPDVEGPLYLKADSKKGWKKYHFVLRASGLYYFPKDKMYYGVGWKKKYKAPTDYCFAIKHPRLQEPKSTKYIKYLCAEDQATLERWMVGMRIAKFGRQLMENYRSLMDENNKKETFHETESTSNNITRQLKEVGETRDETDDVALPSSPALYTNTGTLTRCHSRRKSNHSSHSSDDSSRRKGSVTPTNSLSPQRSVTACSSPDRTPTQSRLNTPVHSPPQSVSGSSCSTPVQSQPAQPFVNGCYSQPQRAPPGQNHDRNGEVPPQPPAYVNPPQYRPQSSTLPANAAFNQVGGLRSSLRQVSLPRQISSTSIASSTNSSASSGNTSISSYITELKNGQHVSSPSLQRKVAQKCKLEPETTPHEVLGFRDPPALLPDYKEHNVSNWVKEHYGVNNLYENVYRDEDCPPSTPQQKQKRPPPPPPPKRSETTQLSKTQQIGY
nr:unnamed protein product [Callosobruchus analis]